MIGQARFAYTDEDMIATQHAGWARCARWRNVLIAYAVMIVVNGALLLGLNAFFGTQPVPADPYAVILGSAAEIALFFGLFFVIARSHAKQVLHKTQRFAWDGDALDGAQVWAWDEDGLHLRHDRGRANLAWSAVGGWLDAPNVLLLFPTGGRPFSLPEPALAAGWKDAPKVFLYPFGSFALALPKRALAAGDAERLVDQLRSTGAQGAGPVRLDRRESGSLRLGDL